jgi:hypothetical protein
MKLHFDDFAVPREHWEDFAYLIARYRQQRVKRRIVEGGCVVLGANSWTNADGWLAAMRREAPQDEAEPTTDRRVIDGGCVVLRPAWKSRQQNVA